MFNVGRFMGDDGLNTPVISKKKRSREGDAKQKHNKKDETQDTRNRSEVKKQSKHGNNINVEDSDYLNNPSKLEEKTTANKRKYDMKCRVDETQLHQQQHQQQQLQPEKKSQLQQIEIKPAEMEAEKVPSVEEDSKLWGLDERLTQSLIHSGIQHFFPIQRQVIPETLAQSRLPSSLGRDICVSASTGSGKTLVFVTTVLNALSKVSKVKRVRALVLLPSRNLAQQVYFEFKKHAGAVGLNVALVCGFESFTAEQRKLTGAIPKPPLMKTFLERGGVVSSMYTSDDDNGTSDGNSCVDIIVGTPGRIVDHIDSTAGFTLQHLRFLIVDEADRMLNQTYHNWVSRVSNAAFNQSPGRVQFSATPGLNFQCHLNLTTCRSLLDHGNSETTRNNSVLATVPLQRMLFSATLPTNPAHLASLNLKNPKFFSLTNQKMNKDRPEFTGSDDLISLPLLLDEKVCKVSPKVSKPLLLIAMLARMFELNTPGSIIMNDDDDEEEEDDEDDDDDDDEEEDDEDDDDEEEDDDDNEEEDDDINRVKCNEGEDISQPPLSVGVIAAEENDVSRKVSTKLILVFASSVDSTHRLARLLQLLPFLKGCLIVEYSGNMSDNQRRVTNKNVLKCRDERHVVVICSDVLSRGVDFPNVTHVINYDSPQSHQTYVHRVGRTARAGKYGIAITFLKSGQESSFYKMRSKLNGGKIGNILNVISSQNSIHSNNNNNESNLNSFKNENNFLKNHKKNIKKSFESYRIPLFECDKLRKVFQRSLKQLEIILQKENRNEIKVGDVLPNSP